MVSSMSSSNTSSSSGGGINLVIGGRCGGGGTSLTSISSSLGFIGISLSRPVDDSSDSMAKLRKPALFALTDSAQRYSESCSVEFGFFFTRACSEKKTSKGCDEGKIDSRGKVPEGCEVAGTETVDEFHG